MLLLLRSCTVITPTGDVCKMFVNSIELVVVVHIANTQIETQFYYAECMSALT